MAQNIVVNWQVNTADLQRSTIAVTRAQKSTDDLRKSTQSYGKDAQKAGSEATKSFQSVGKEIQSVGQGVGTLVSTFKTFIAALAIREIANASIEMANLAGNVEGVERAFRRLPNSTALLNDLRDATAGTVSDFQLMQTAIKAQNFKIPLDQLGTLLEFAAAKAQQTGESVEYLVDSIITGIGRESPLILDNLQLRMQDLNKVIRETGVSLGEAVGVVARQQLEEMGGLVETGAVKVQRLEAAWKNFLEGTATIFYEGSGMSDLLDKLANFLQGDVTLADKLALDPELVKQFTGLDFGTIRNEAQAQTVRQLQSVVEDLRDAFDITEITDFKSAFDDIYISFLKVIPIEKEAEKITRQFIQALIDEQNATVQSARLQAALRLEKLRAETFERRAVEVLKQTNLEIFKAAEAEKLQADATRLLQPELENLANTFKLNEVNIEDFNDSINQSINDVRDFMDAIKETVEDADIRTALQVIGDAFEEVKKELQLGAVDITRDYLQATIDAELQSYQVRIDALQSFYDEQILLAGDNERAKEQLRLNEQRQLDQLRKEQARKEKEARKFSVIIDTAAALARIWITPGWPLAVPFSALIVAQGAAQLAAINRAQPRGFKEGVLNLQGPGTSKSDSIPAMLSKGESVITAERTQKAFNVIKEVSAGRLDDRVLAKLQNRGPVVNVSGMDDSRIVAAIKSQNYPDFIQVGNTVYEAKKTGENHRRKVKKYSF